MAKHGTMISVLLAGSVAWAQQPGSAPGGPAAQVAKIKVQPDKAPDCSSLKAIAESVTRDCKTNDARAIAIYNFMLLAHYHCPYASEDGGIPALKVIHVYGWGVCGGQCSIMSSLWKQLGWNWRFMGWPGHTTMEAEYDGRWHYLDSFLKIYAWMPDGKGTAKPAAADELQTLPNPFMVGTEPPPAPIVPPAGNDNGEPWKPWLERKLLAPEEAESTMARFVEGQLRELPLPEDAGAWLARRDGLRQEVLAILGIDDLVPPRWELNVQPKGILRREGYRIEKLTFESYPGMAVPALLYIPEAIRGRAPGIVSIAGHAYATGKTTEHLQQRNVNLVLRGCVVLSYDYIDTGERNTGADPRHGQVYGGGNDHGIRSFSFSRRTPTGLEALDG
ncbi:MAG: hypothetical protein FJW35_18815, partial [Acidobacteria bacterium]|nr:hypothetical protein [Acidobacteriota bacterium]